MWRKSLHRDNYALSRSSHPVCSVKMMFLEISQNSQENTCEFCGISKNTFLHRTPLVTSSKSLPTMGTCVEKLSNCCDYFLRLSGFPELSGKVFLLTTQQFFRKSIVNETT